MGARFATLLLYLVIAHVAFAAEPLTVITSKKAATTSPSYARISLVVEGDAFAFSDGPNRGRFIRLVVVDEDLAYGAPTLRVETLVYGDEVCCRRVLSARTVNLNELFESGVLQSKEKYPRFTFTKWLSATSFEFGFGERAYRLSNVDQPKFQLAKLK